MIFRPMARTDETELHALFAEMSEESAGFFNGGGCNEKLTKRFFTDEGVPTHEFYVASDGTNVLGYVFLWETDKTVPWFGICVREKFKGRHIGTFMLTNTLALLRERGYAGLLLTTVKTNIRAQALYEKCGFERLGVHECGEYLYLRRFDK